MSTSPPRRGDKLTAMPHLRTEAAALAFLMALLVPAAFAAGPAAPGEECLACHAQQGLTKTLDKGDVLPLHVAAEAFAGSVHAPLGCSGCHAAIDLKKHPATTRKFDSARSYAMQAAEACKTCHEPIYNAYLGSTHGKARENGAPICSDCHKPHEVTHTALAAPKDTCATCHPTAVEAHQKWLPNAAHHFEVVSCAACHSPGSQKKVDLRLYDASGNEVRSGAPVPGNEPLDEKKLAQYVRGASRDAKVTLVGRLEVVDGAQLHAIGAGAGALKDCTTCHRKGAEAFQNVTLSVLGPDGRRTRYEAHANVLQAPTSVDSVRGFYAIGGTRIQLLDIALALVVLGGICGPLLHFLIRRVSRRNKDTNHA
jgi:hypothetical protein